MNYLVQLGVLCYTVMNSPWAQVLRGQGTDGNWFIMESSPWGFGSFSECHSLIVIFSPLMFDVHQESTFIKHISLRNELATVMSKELWVVPEKWAGRHGETRWEAHKTDAGETEDGISRLWPSTCKISDGFWPGHSTWATGEKFTIHEQNNLTLEQRWLSH